MIRKLLAVFLGLGLLGAAFATFDSDAFGLKKFVSVTSGSQPRSVTNQVAARELSLVCPGAGYTESSSSGSSASFAPLGLAEVGVNQNSVSKFFAASSPTVVKASANDSGLPQGSALLSANQTQAFKATAKGFAAGANGLLAADCVRPSSDFWFLGASTAVGRQAILIVNNPSAVDSTFNLEIFDEGGLVTAPGMQGLSVAAGKTLVLPLAAFATSDPTLALHISSQGGAVAAWVQQKTVRGTVAAGIDFISPSSPPGKLEVLPGLTVTGSKAATEIAKANPDYGDLAPVVRIFVPQATAASAKTVSVTVVVSGIDAKTFGTVVRQDINVCQTTDVALSGLADGRYSVAVTADKPLFASMRLSANAKDPAKVLTATGSDFTWISAAEAITTVRNILVPSRGASSLNIANDSNGQSIVTLTDVARAKSATYVLPASGLLDLPASPGANLQISATSKVYANLTTRRDNGIGSLKILDAKNLGGKVAVTVR